MSSNRTFTFKRRRKSHPMHYFLLIVFSLSIINSAALPCPEGCNCFFSFPDSLKTASCEEIKSTGTIFPSIRLLELKSRKSDVKCSIPDEATKIFPNLLVLNMTNCSMNEIQSDTFASFPNLQNIDLSHNQISDFDMNTFKANKNLRYINLEDNKLRVLRSPFIVSSSLIELNLASNNIEKLPMSIFKESPSLIHLSLANNKIRTIRDNTLPEKLRTLDLSSNNIVNIPTDELGRFNFLIQINLSENPVNCTCSLIAFQNWFSGRGTIFVNGIKCAQPAPYIGYNLASIPEYDMCDAQVLKHSSSLEQCSGNQICNNIVVENGVAANQPTDDSEFLEKDQVFMARKTAPTTEAEDLMLADEGSGDDTGTDTPETPSLTTAESKSSQLPQPTPEGVVKVSSELKNPGTERPQVTTVLSITSNESTTIFSSSSIPEEPVTQDVSSSSQAPEEPITNVSSSSQAPEEPFTGIPSYSQAPEEPVTDISSSSQAPEKPVTNISSQGLEEAISSSTETVTTISFHDLSSSANTSPTESVIPTNPDSDQKSTEHNNHAQLQQRLLNENTTFKDKELAGFVVPGLAVLAVALICMTVFCVQFVNKKKRYRLPISQSSCEEGSEMQEVSLLPAESKTVITMKNKYPKEKDSGQTERLMNGDSTKEVEDNSNISHNSDDTVDCSKLPNDHSKKENVPAGNGNVECTVVKVTTIPDSIPKRPIIKNM